MAKRKCVICGKEVGMLTAKTEIYDGVICAKCLRAEGMTELSNPRAYNTYSMRVLINKRAALVSRFRVTKTVGSLNIDENNKLFRVGGDLFEYDNLLSFELLENGETITKGGIGRAVAGGLLFGGVGATVGALTGPKRSRGVCTSMKMRLTLKNAHIDTVYIPFVTREVKTGSFVYKAAQKTAQQCISALQIILDVNQAANQASAASGAISAADEIVKFKQLMDAGVITAAEFEAKKKQLLGL